MSTTDLENRVATLEARARQNPNLLYEAVFKESITLYSQDFLGKEKTKKREIKRPGKLQEYGKSDFLAIVFTDTGEIIFVDKSYIKQISLDESKETKEIKDGEA